MNLEDQIKTCLSNYCDDQERLKNLGLDEDFKEALQIDSVEMVALFVDIEDLVDIDVEEDQMYEISSINDIIEITKLNIA